MAPKQPSADGAITVTTAATKLRKACRAQLALQDGIRLADQGTAKWAAVVNNRRALDSEFGAKAVQAELARQRGSN